MIDTAENVVAKFGVSAAEQNEVALARYVQYQEALAEDRAFQRRYMVDVPVTDAGFRKQTGLLCADEGVFPTTAEGLAKLKPVKPNGSVGFGTQTHPADGNAGMIVTTRELARVLDRSENRGGTARLRSGKGWPRGTCRWRSPRLPWRR